MVRRTFLNCDLSAMVLQQFIPSLTLPMSFSGVKRRFEHALRVDRPPATLNCVTPGSLPATQGQRWEDHAKAVNLPSLCIFRFVVWCWH